MTSRRGFIAGLLAAGTAPQMGWAFAGSPAYLAAAREPDGGFALFGFHDDGIEVFRIPLPARGHAGAGHPTRAEAVAFARRPGNFALIIDCISGTVRQTLAPPAGRHFNGHGVFAQGGALLFTSEQHQDSSEGVIGVWDTQSGYSRIGELSTHGIGPHELRLMPDQQTLVVANGGIMTDPTDRSKLNIDTMRPNLAYVGFEGTLHEMMELPLELGRNSIRHLAVRGDGLVGFAMQWQGDDGAATPLLGLHRRGSEPVLASAPLADELVMRGYAGSIAFSGDSTEIAITSPRGGRLHRFTEEGVFLGAVSRRDICGLATHPAGMIASDGLGGLLAIEGVNMRPLARADRAWDNHIVSLNS